MNTNAHFGQLKARGFALFRLASAAKSEAKSAKLHSTQFRVAIHHPRGA